MQPDRVINGVSVYVNSVPVNSTQMGGLQRIYVGSTRFLNRSDRIQQLFPDLFPPDDFHMDIRKKIYNKVLQLYNDEPPRNRPAHKTILEYLQNIDREFNTTGFGFPYDRPLANELMGVSYQIQRRVAATYNELDEEIFNHYRDEGYVFHYFSWVNLDNNYLRAKMDQIPLRPDTFEAFSILNLYPEQYEQTIDAINRRKNERCMSQDDNLYFTNYLGWSKINLINAIKRSGLLESVPYRTDPNRNHRVLTWKRVGIQPTHAKRNTYYGRTVPGMRFRQGQDFNTSALDQRMCFWETLYRKMFNTQAFINWPVLCQNKAVSYDKLKKVAHQVFGVKNAHKMKYDQLCREISSRQENVRQTQLDFAKVAKDSRMEVLLRPGSQLVSLQAPTRSQFMEGQRVTGPYQQYQAIQRLCQSSSDQQEILNGLESMGLRYIYPDDMSAYTKEDICEDLLEQFRYRAEKYGNIETYCNNPDIPLDLIYALVERAGLDSILPTDWEDYSKEQICDILNKYLNILRSTKSPL